jgi:hypothetical protein
MNHFAPNLRPALRVVARLTVTFATFLSLEAGTVAVKNKTAKGPQKLLWLFTPFTPSDPSAPVLAVMPLLGPAGELMPGGKLLVWVGRTDGEPLADVAVTVRVPELEDGNTLVSSGQRVHSVTLRSDANGLAQAIFAAPNKPPEKNGNGGGPTPE